jgi:hypothetical protein
VHNGLDLHTCNERHVGSDMGHVSLSNIRGAAGSSCSMRLKASAQIFLSPLIYIIGYTKNEKEIPLTRLASIQMLLTGEPNKRLVICIHKDGRTLKITTPSPEAIHQSKEFLLCGNIIDFS